MSSSANVWVPILVAIVTGLVTVITVYLTGQANLKLAREKFVANSQLEQQKFETNSKLERQKFESSQVLPAIATGKPETAQKNLEFLVSAGFLPVPEGKIKELAKRPADTPVLPASGGAPQMKSRAPVFRWKVRTGSDPDASLVKERDTRRNYGRGTCCEPRPADMRLRPKSIPPIGIAGPKAWRERSMKLRQRLLAASCR